MEEHIYRTLVPAICIDNLPKACRMCRMRIGEALARELCWKARLLWTSCMGVDFEIFYDLTSSTAQGGGGTFRLGNKPVGPVG